MIEVEKNMCCGCSACVQVCPKHCISFIEDEEGFLYPTIEKENCVECGLCKKGMSISGYCTSKESYSRSIWNEGF